MLSDPTDCVCVCVTTHAVNPVTLQDKILLGNSGEVTVTNDGATILKAIGVDNPAAKVLVGTYGGYLFIL